MFRNYAESNRGFKSFQIQVSTASLEQQRRRDRQQIDYLKENVGFAAANSRDFLAAITKSHAMDQQWRKELKSFYDMNAQHIFEADKRELKARLDAAEYRVQNPGVGKPQQSTLEKIQPFLQLAGKAAGMLAEAHQEREQEEIKQTGNYLKNQAITGEITAHVSEHKEALWNQTADTFNNRKELYEVADLNHLDPNDNEVFAKNFPEKMWHRILHSTGKQQDIYQAIQVTNSMGQFEKTWNKFTTTDIPIPMEDGSTISSIFALGPNNTDRGIFEYTVNYVKNWHRDEFNMNDVSTYLELDDRAVKNWNGITNSKMKEWEVGRAKAVWKSKLREQQLALELATKTGDQKALKEYLGLLGADYGATIGKDGKVTFADTHAGKVAENLYRARVQADLTALSQVKQVPADKFNNIVDLYFADHEHSLPYWAEDLKQGKLLQNEEDIYSANRALKNTQDIRTDQLMFALDTDPETKEYLNGLSDKELLRFFTSKVGVEGANRIMSYFKANSPTIGETSAEKLVNMTDVKKQIGETLVSHYIKKGVANITLSKVRENTNFMELDNILTNKWMDDFNAEFMNNGNDEQAARNYAFGRLNQAVESGKYDPINIHEGGGSKALTPIRLLEFNNQPQRTTAQDPLLSETTENINANLSNLSEVVKNNIGKIIPVDDAIQRSIVNGEVNWQVLAASPSIKRLQQELGPNYTTKHLADLVMKAGGLEGIDPLLVTDVQEMKILYSKYSENINALEIARNRLNQMYNVDHPSSIAQQVIKRISEPFQQQQQPQVTRNISLSGNTGKSTGPHADFGAEDAQGNTINPSKYFSQVIVFDKPLSEQMELMTSPMGMRRDPVHGGLQDHQGYDFAFPVGTPIKVIGGVLEQRRYDPGGYGWSDGYRMKSDGGLLWISHIQADQTGHQQAAPAVQQSMTQKQLQEREKEMYGQTYPPRSF